MAYSIVVVCPPQVKMHMLMVPTAAEILQYLVSDRQVGSSTEDTRSESLDSARISPLKKKNVCHLQYLMRLTDRLADPKATPSYCCTRHHEHLLATPLVSLMYITRQTQDQN